MARGDAAKGSGDFFSDSELNAKLFSPTCTYCRYWKPTDGQHCDAYPKGGKAIPEAIWSGDSTHVFPFGGEVKREGQPILFELHPAVAPRAVPAKIKADLAKRDAQAQAQAKANAGGK